MRGARLGTVGRTIAVVGALLCSSVVRGQSVAATDTARCDSIVGAARVDSIPAGLFISARRIDGGELDSRQSDFMVSQIGAMFAPPKPFRLTVFSGSVRMRILRTRGDSVADLRAPSVTGIYRFASVAKGPVTGVVTVRASLMPGFDSAAMTAIRNAPPLPPGIAPSGSDSMLVETRISSDSIAGSRRLVSAYFPRMPLVDAEPRRDNPAPVFPEDEKRDSVTSGNVVLRFVVDRSGMPLTETLEIVRATSASFLRAAIDALPKQRFDPATIRGCAVAEVIDYPFTFVLPDPSSA